MEKAEKLIDDTIKDAVLHMLLGWLHNETVTEGD